MPLISAKLLYYLLVIIVCLHGQVLIAHVFALYFNKKKSKSQVKDTGLSLIICAKNEDTNLGKNIPLFLRQTHSSLEIILVLHQCQDGSLQAMQELAETDDRLKVFPFKDNRPGKKHALKYGKSLASHKRMLLTDADCWPEDDSVLENIDQVWPEDKAWFLGYSPIKPNGKFWSLWEDFEHRYVALQYLGAAALGSPYMGVGRNLGLANRLGKLESSQDTKSGGGDDDLFVNEYIRQGQYVLGLEPKMWIFTDAVSSLKSYVSKKLRHYETSFKYKRSQKVYLGILHGLHVSFFPLFFLFLFQNYVIEALLVMALRLVIVWIPWAVGFSMLGKKKIVWLIPIWDILFCLNLLLFLPFLFRPKKVLWM